MSPATSATPLPSKLNPAGATAQPSTSDATSRRAKTPAAGKARCCTATYEDSPSLAARILILKEAQAQRVTLVRALVAHENTPRALARRALGWKLELPEKDRAKIVRRAAVLVDALQSGEQVPVGTEQVAASIAGLVLAFAASAEPLHAERLKCERILREGAETLPVWPWVEAVPGFGALGLAQIVGSCGDLDEWRSPAGLWKRFGLAPRACYDDVTLDGRPCNKMPKRRRSVMYVIGDSLLKGNKTGDGNNGVYRELYLERRAYEVARNPAFDKGIDKKTGKQKVTKHCHLRAQRYVEKRLLRDLWRAWRDAAKII